VKAPPFVALVDTTLLHRGISILRGPKADAALMMQLGSDGGRQYIPFYHADPIDYFYFYFKCSLVRASSWYVFQHKTRNQL
jgi:hypothetical protein